MFLKVPNSFRSLRAVFGPMFGKPSKIYCSCSLTSRGLGLSFIPISLSLVGFSARTFRNFAVSSWFFVKRIGIW